LEFSKSSWNSRVPLPGGGGGGGLVTVTDDEPDFAEHVAVMVVDPAATPVTTPLELTVAIAELFVDQVMVWPVITFPCWSFTVAVKVTVAPVWIEGLAGLTVTVVTTGAGGGGGGAVTVTPAVPDFPELLAVIVAEPAATPDTTPFPSTDAIEALFEDQLIGWPLITLPPASFTVACSGVVAPTAREAEDGFTVTLFTVCVGGGWAGVDTVAMFDSAPNTASVSNVPRKATTWKLYAVDGERPRTLQVIWLPADVPASGVAQVPSATDVADPHEIGAGA
jgi:hypothetical protein